MLIAVHLNAHNDIKIDIKLQYNLTRKYRKVCRQIYNLHMHILFSMVRVSNLLKCHCNEKIVYTIGTIGIVVYRYQIAVLMQSWKEFCLLFTEISTIL